jgi:MerR family transcriptional regulator, light-induced transcriptional regulator
MKMYNINSVVNITGLSAFVIRAWEKRYNVVTPGRTDSNRRFYSEKDIEKLKLLKEAVDRGNSIGNIAHLSIESLKEMLASFGNVKENNTAIAGHDQADRYLQKCIKAVEDFDYRNLENFLIRSSIELSHPLLIDEVVIPLLRTVGENWQKGTLRIAQEHLASAVIRTFLYNLRDSYKPTDHSSKILITTPVGQQHEFGALIASLVASAEGWEAVYLGPDLPTTEIAATAILLKPKIVALSIVYSAEDEQLNKEIEKLKYLPENIKVIIGGAGSGFYRKTIESINAVLLDDFVSFRNYLRTMGKNGA